MATKSRSIEFGGPVKGILKTWTVTPKGTLVGDVSESVSPNSSINTALTGTQVTESYGHPGYRSVKRGRYLGDVGGNFLTKKRSVISVTTDPVSLFGRGFNGTNWNMAEYHGPFLPIGPGSMIFPPYASSSNLNALGTTAIARCAPTNPTADLSVFLGETINEGIPQMIGATLKKWRGLSDRERRRAIGGEYLNVEFGWKPLVSDLQKLASAIVHAEEVLSQYERDSGRMVRRQYTFPPSEVIGEVVVANNVSPWIQPSGGTLTDPNLAGKGKVIRRSSVTKRQWFKGAFTYYLPPADSVRGEMARAALQAKKLLGLSLTPDVVWNLTPWSWAIDWIANTGDLLKNLSAWSMDNQVLLYGYMMEHTVSSYTYTFTGPTGYRSSDVRPDAITLVSESKARQKATPFGFGLSFGNFTNRQKAIVAALGISKSR